MALITGKVVHWAATECAAQMSGEMSVAWMIDGWLYAHRRRNNPIRLGDVIALGQIVEPRRNPRGIRVTGVRVGFDIKMDPALVPAALNQLVVAQGDLSPDDWYRQYEDIHPFRDGNGRTGSILWNWLSRTLAVPAVPPNFW